MPARAGVAYVDIFPNFDKFATSLQAGLRGPVAQMDRLGSTLTKKLSLPLLALGGLALKAGVDVDDAFDTIRATTGKTGVALRGIERDFEAIAKRTPASLGAIAPVVGSLNAALGVTGKQLQTLASQILEAGRITKQGEIPVQSITRVFGDWSVATDQQSATLDKLFRASQLTATPIQRLSELVVQFGAPLRTLGFSLDQSIALFGKFTEEGVNVETTLAGMRKFLQATAKAGRDPAVAFREVSAEIQRLARAGREAEAFKLGAEQFGARSFQDLTRAIIENRFELGGLVKEIQTGQDTILGVAKETKDFGEQLQQFRNTAQLALAPIGQRLFPLLEKGVKALVPLLNGLIGFFDALGPAAGPAIGALIALGPVLKIAAFGIKVFKVLRVVLFNLRVAFFLLRGAILANPFALLVAAVVAVGVVIFKFRKQILGALEAVGRFFARIGRDFVNGLRVIGDFFSNAASAFGRFFTQTLPNALVGALAALGRFFLALPGRILGFINQGLQTLIAGVIVLGVRIVQGLLQGIESYVKFVIDFWVKLPGRILMALGAIATFLFNAGQTIIKGLLNGIVAYFRFVIDFYRKLPGRIIALFAAAGTWLFKAGTAILTGLYNGIKQIWNTVIAFFKSLPGAIVRAIGDLSKLLFNIGKSILTGLIDGAKKALSGVKDFFGGIGKKITQWKGPLTDDKVLLTPAGEIIMKGLVQGVENEEDALRRALTRVTGNVKGLFGDFGGDMRLQAQMSGVAGSVTAAGDTNITNNITVNNPKPERLELSLPAALRRAELARARG